jgi:predicted RNA binding protein YcfA (HicA-like mRNA interferase family)
MSMNPTEATNAMAKKHLDTETWLHLWYHYIQLEAGFDMGHLEKLRKLHDKLKTSQDNVTFSDLCKLAEMVGFSFDRQRGSHRVYRHEKVPGIMNFQEVKRKAKPYQVKQLLDFISEHNLFPKEA